MIDTGINALDNALTERAEELLELGYSRASIIERLDGLVNSKLFNVIDTIGKVSEVYDIAGIASDFILVGFDVLKDGRPGFESSKKLFCDIIGLIGGEIGTYAGAFLVGMFSEGTATAIGGAIGDVLTTKISKYGADYVFECLFSEGIDGELVIDVEFEVILEKWESGKLNEPEELIDCLGEYFNSI